MYATTWLLDWTHLFGATRSREVIDEFARWTADELDYLVEARQAVLLYEHAQGDKVERIARVYRDYTTSRVLTTELIDGIPLIEIMIAKREGNTAYLEALAAARPRPRPDRPPPRLEHAQPGLRVRLLPRRPAPGQPLRAAGRRDRLRRLRDRRPAARPRPRLAHPLQLAALPGRGRGRRPRAHALAGAGPDDRHRDAPAGSSSASTRRSCTTPSPTGSRTTRRRPGPPAHDREPVLEARRRHPRHDPRPAADDVAEHRRATSRCWSRSARCGTQLAVEYDLQENVRRFVRRLARQQGLALLDPRRTFDRLYAGTGRIQRALEFLEFVEAQEPVITEATDVAVRLPQPDPAREAAAHRLRHRRPGRRRRCSTSSSSSPTTPGGSFPREMDYTGSSSASWRSCSS